MLVVRVLAALSLALVAVPACGLLSRRSDAKAPPADSEVLLEVESHHWSDIVIYLMNGSQSQRLGMLSKRLRLDALNCGPYLVAT